MIKNIKMIKIRNYKMVKNCKMTKSHKTMKNFNVTLKK